MRLRLRLQFEGSREMVRKRCARLDYRYQHEFGQFGLCYLRTLPSMLRCKSIFVHKQCRHLGSVPTTVVQNDKQYRDIVSSTDPKSAFHLGEEECAIAHADESR